MTGSARVINANARNLPLEDDSVDLVVTSPPYFGLRSYQDGGEHYEGQIGDEATPAEFVAALLDVTRECVRVLKPTGSLWVNLGDKYAGGGGQWDKDDRDRPLNGASTLARNTGTGGKTYGLRAKSLIGIPWRYALACIDDLGLILRAEVIWSKPNGLPESVTDRVRRSHEQWFHFTLEPRYYSAVDEVREQHVDPSRHAQTRSSRSDRRAAVEGRYGKAASSSSLPPQPGEGGTGHPLGKLPGSVWTIPTEPLRVPDHLGVDHFAAFPTEWPLRIIRGWSPANVCSACGEGRRPVTDRSPMQFRPSARNVARKAEQGTEHFGNNAGGTMLAAAETRITGYACSCPDTAAPSTPGVVLDPFGGTGTTALVAKALGRTGISVDMSADYCRLAEWRTTDPDQLERVRTRIRAHGETTDLTDTDDPGLFGGLDGWDE